MKRILMLVCASVVSSCVNGIPCDPMQPNTCPAPGVCHPALKICVTADGGTGGGGTTGGGGATGGGGVGGGVATGGGGMTGGGGGATGGGGACMVSMCDDGQECGAGGCQNASVEIVVVSQPTVVGQAPQMVSARIQRTGMMGDVSGLKLPTSVMLTPSVGLLMTAGSTTVAGDGTFSFSVAALANANGPGVVTVSFGAQPVTRDVMVDADTAGPTFTFELDAVPDAGFITPQGVDLRVPGGMPAFRKDEVVLVRVRSTASDVGVGGVQLTARHQMDQPLTLMSSMPCGGSAYCREFQLDLSVVEMKAFGGPINLSATGSDVVGNPGSGSMPSAFNVTRFNWARQIGLGATTGVIRASPAIGTGGRVFVGVAQGTTTGVVAVNPNGTQAWAHSRGGVTGPLAVGRSNGVTEWVVFQPTAPPDVGMPSSLNASNGSTGTNCSAGTSGVVSEGGLALVGESTNEVGGIGLQAGQVGLRATWAIPNASTCRDTLDGGLSRVQLPGNMVATSNSVFFVDSSGRLKQIDYSLLSLVMTQTPLAVNVGGVGTVNGLALLSGTRVAGGGGPGIGRLFAVETDGGNPWPAATPFATPVSGPAVGGVAVGGALFAQLRDGLDRSVLVRVNANTGQLEAHTLLETTFASSFTGNGVPTPALGEDGRVYAVDEAGRLFVVAQNFAPDAGSEWATPLPAPYVGSAPMTAGPTLDCNRIRPGSQSGVLYIATDNGWLVSYLVDAKGLDTTATWPKYARDARNTGNFNGPAIQQCP